MPSFELLSLSKRAFAKYKPRGLFRELRYAHFSKKQKMLKLCFYLIHLNLVKTPKFTMQKTSTWQTHLPLQVETLLQYRIHQSYTGNYHCMHSLYT